MAKHEVRMPKMGESIIEATILEWSVDIGASVEIDDPLLEIATDKVDSEVPSEFEGVLTEIRFQKGDVVPVGEVIAVIESEAAAGDAPESVSSNGHSEPEVKKEEAPAVKPQLEPALVTAGGPVNGGGHASRANGKFFSPLVLNIARTEGVSMEELEGLNGSGQGGRVTKKDILAYVKGPRTKPAPQQVQPQQEKKTTTQSAPVSGVIQKTFSHSGEYEIVEMDRMRKMIAENMVYSKHVSAHVTSFVEADMTNVVLWRNRNKEAFQKKYGEKLTFTPIFIEAVCRVLRELPMVNVSVDGDKILVKKDINMGIAVALPNDNLIVPVIKNADRMNLVGLSAAVNDLANRARNNKLKPDELEGGTYTLSNVGTFGNVMGTPVILQPQVAIMATGAIRKKPAVIETDAGDFIGIRHMMFLSHSYDHRVIDGALGGRFVKMVADVLENWDMNREV